MSEVLLGPGFAHLFGTDGFGNDLFRQCLGAAVITIIRVLGAWLFVAVPAVVLSLRLGSTRSAGMRGVHSLVEALGGIPPLFVLLLASFFGVNRMGEQTVVIWIVLLPEAIRRITEAVADTNRQPFIAAARDLGLEEPVVRRWYILPAIAESIRALALAMAFRILVFDITLGFLGYGRVAALVSFGELFRNNRSLFLLPHSGTGHVLPALVFGVVLTILAIRVLVQLFSAFSIRRITGGDV